MEFNSLMEAITAYYGDNSVAATFSQMVDAQGFLYGGANNTIQAQSLAQAMEQIPNVKVTRAVDGSLIRMQYTGGEYAAQSLSNVLSGAANSNTGSAVTETLNSAGNTVTKVKTPIEMTTQTTQTGEKVVSNMTSGAMKAGHLYTGKITVADVLGPIAAVGTGIALGKKIDSALYNLNPDFWDDNGMAAINPETWDSITSEEDGVNGRLFNMLFGIESDKTQPYIEQTAFAYLTQYMIAAGVFDSGAPSYDYDFHGQSYRVNLSDSFTSSTIYIDQPVYVLPSGTTFTSNGSIFSITNIPANTILAVLRWNTTDRFYIFSKSPGAQITYTMNGTTYTTSGTSSMPSITVGGVTYTFYMYEWLLRNSGSIEGIAINTTNNIPQYTLRYLDVCRVLMAFIGFYGEMQGGTTIDGITDQTGATIFDPSSLPDNPSISDILSALQSQFPDLFTNAVTNTVIDPETGEEVTHTYLPVGYPEIDPENPTQPTGETSTQTNPSYDPEEYPDIADMIAQLISFIPQTNPETHKDEMVEDPITDPNPPDTGSGITPAIVTPDGSASALFAVYNPTQAQVDSFGAWLWSNDFVEQLKKIFNDPMESIISLHKVFATPSTGSAQNIYVGYLNSNVSSATVTSQYTTVDCGSVQLREYFGNVYDYADTKIDLYLPFVGIVKLSTSDIMRSIINIKYHVDVLTGACLVDVLVSRDLSEAVLYQYSGDCAVHYPVSAGSYMGIVTGILSIAGGIAGTVATGGALAPAMIGAGAAATRMHTDVSRSGGFSGNSGAMGAKKPYLIISRPQTALPTKYNEIEGVGSNQTVLLSTCVGLTVVKDVRLKNIGATDNELTEIENLLKEGVIV